MRAADLDNLLPLVSRPARYIGGEWNSVGKDQSQVRLAVALAFPDAYEVGMSHLGIQLLYQILNKMPEVQAERVFAPWTDMAALLTERRLPLTSLETGRPLSQFDLVGFSLQHELNYTNVLFVLSLAGIPLLSHQRAEGGWPLVCAGGPCTCNPEPLADFFDFFVLGEGDEVVKEIAATCLAHGRPTDSHRRERLLESLAGLTGIYVPSFYRAAYEDGRLTGVTATNLAAPAVVQKRMVRDFASLPIEDRPVVPFLEAAQDRVAIEISRGCPHGCRFCQVGYICRPYRERKVEAIIPAAVKSVKNTGLEQVSLLALNCMDHSQIKELTARLREALSPMGVSISLPSTRVDTFDLEAAWDTIEVKRSGLTVAPEAGSERMRGVIHKDVTRAQLLDLVSQAFGSGWHVVKLYYMIGLPTETEADLLAIGEEVQKVLTAARKSAHPRQRGRIRVHVSLATLVPKPHTAFQWEPQLDRNDIRDRQRIVMKGLMARAIHPRWHDPEQTLVESLLARGDRRLCHVILKVHQMGGRFDGWSEHFSWQRWDEALTACGLTWAEYLRERAEDELLPWDHLSFGVQKSFLLRERHRARVGSAGVS